MDEQAARDMWRIGGQARCFSPAGDTSLKLLVPGRVVASGKIPQGAMTSPIEPERLQGITDIVQLSVRVNTFGGLELEENSTKVWSQNIHWVRAMRLADDCHSYNVQLRRIAYQQTNESQPTTSLVLQVVRNIEPGQELLLWFSEDVLATVQMGFLTPANIQGQKNYVCTRCSALYESPNPLKLHLTLNCGKFGVSTLWDKLAESKEVNGRIEFRFKLSPEHHPPKQKIAIDLSTPQLEKRELYKPYRSAFKPFQKLENPHNILLNNNLAWPRFTMPGDFVHPAMVPQGSCDEEAQIESLVSSLGKFKEGHICLYCGKSYSRKYGLKIHIRTHTGYKPLKCKFCLRPFGDPSNLNKHVRLHAEGETPYKCDLCGKVLVRRRDLERHLKSRHMNDMNPQTTSVTDDDSNGNSISDEERPTEEPAKA